MAGTPELYGGRVTRACPRRELWRGGLEDELDLETDVVAIAQRSHLSRRRTVDARVIEGEPERVADVRDARLVQDRALPVVEERVDRDDPTPVVRGGDQQGVEELVVLQVNETGTQATRTFSAARGRAGDPRRAGRHRRVGAVPTTLAVHRLALEPRCLRADDRVVGRNRERQ